MATGDPSPAAGQWHSLRAVGHIGYESLRPVVEAVGLGVCYPSLITIRLITAVFIECLLHARRGLRMLHCYLI